MSYSIIIRTLSGGEKYQQLLDSIDSQTLKPEHVYVIQPHGWDAPAQRLGYEEFIHTKKGMWEQRIFGMEYCYDQPEHSRYLLVCDDDVKFEPNFAESLLKIAEEYNCDTLVPISDHKAGTLKNLFNNVLGGGELRTKVQNIKLPLNQTGVSQLTMI